MIVKTLARNYAPRTRYIPNRRSLPQNASRLYTPTHGLVASLIGTSSTPQPSKFTPPTLSTIADHASAMPIHAIVLTSQCIRIPMLTQTTTPNRCPPGPSFFLFHFTSRCLGFEFRPRTVYALLITGLNIPSTPLLCLFKYLCWKEIPLLFGTLLPNMSNTNHSFLRAGSLGASPNLSTFTPSSPNRNSRHPPPKRP